MEVEEMEVEFLELKYCERCGGLWLRPRGEEEVYCGPCIPKMAEFPDPGIRRRAPRLPVAKEVEIEGCLDELLAWCVEGGNA